MCSKVTRLVDPAFEAVAQWFQHIRIEDMPLTASNKKKGNVMSLLPPQRPALRVADLLQTVHRIFCICCALIFSWLFLGVLFENKIYSFNTLAVILDRKSTRLNSSHVKISYAVFCLKKKKKTQ